MTNTWGPIHAAELAAATRATYAALYSKHIGPYLGATRLRDLNADQITRWQASRAASGAGREAVRRALRLLGGILQRAVEHGALTANPARVVRPIKRQTRAEVRPLAPRDVEAIRRQLDHRDAVLVSVLAYAVLRPGEALALRWEDVRERTLLVERAVALGEMKGTKTGPSRTVKLLRPLAQDLAEWRMRAGRPRQRELVFPGRDGGPWSLWDWQHWRNRTYARAMKAADLDYVKPYSLRHSFASLLLAEGRSVHYVARQLGHAPSMTLDVYGHVYDELEDAGQVDAETVVRDARSVLTIVERSETSAETSQLLSGVRPRPTPPMHQRRRYRDSQSREPGFSSSKVLRRTHFRLMPTAGLRARTRPAPGRCGGIFQRGRTVSPPPCTASVPAATQPSLA